MALGPPIKTGYGRASWSSTMLVVWFTFMIITFATGVFYEAAQKLWPIMVDTLPWVIGGYGAMRGADTYERKGGTSSSQSSPSIPPIPLDD